MSDIMVVANLFISFLLGGAIGWLREIEGKTAGLRTHILVAVGSTLFTILSMEMMSISGCSDPGRLTAGIVTGIGFIGAGCIIQAGGGVKGITTAASIWVVSAIGVAAGMGYYVAAVATTVISLFTIQVLGHAEHRVMKSKEREEAKKS